MLPPKMHFENIWKQIRCVGWDGMGVTTYVRIQISFCQKYHQIPMHFISCPNIICTWLILKLIICLATYLFFLLLSYSSFLIYHKVSLLLQAKLFLLNNIQKFCPPNTSSHNICDTTSQNICYKTATEYELDESGSRWVKRMNVDENICSATWLSDAVISPQSKQSKQAST